MQKSALVSVIIPVYNVSSYLAKCLDSIEEQTYSNTQVIIVNDGSTDNSMEICSQYAGKNHWTLINQKNGGLSAARNTGLDNATGDYVIFVDSDDWLDCFFVEKLVNALETYDADIAECGIRWVYSNNVREEKTEIEMVLSMRDALSSYLLQTRPIHSAVCCKIYKKKIFDNLRFEVGKLHEDGFFTYRAMYQANKYALISYVGYNYRQNRQGSIMSIEVKPQNIIDVTDMMEQRIQFFYERDEKELAEKAAAYYYRTTLTNYTTVLTKLNDEKLAGKLKDKLDSSKQKIFRNRWLGIKKIKFVLFFNFPHIYFKKYMKRV